MVDDIERIRSIEQLLDELEGYAQKTPFFFPHRIVIPDQEFFRICMALREALPVVLKEAQQVIKERDSFVENAKREHRRILETAQQRMQELVSEDVIVREAQHEAERILSAAREEAEETKREALMYTDDLLEKLADSFSSTLETVSNGRKMIRRFLERSEQETHDSDLELGENA